MYHSLLKAPSSCILVTASCLCWQLQTWRKNSFAISFGRRFPADIKCSFSSNWQKWSQVRITGRVHVVQELHLRRSCLQTISSPFSKVCHMDYAADNCILHINIERKIPPYQENGIYKSSTHMLLYTARMNWERVSITLQSQIFICI